MNKLEINFSSSIPYNNDELTRNINMSFEIDRDLGVDQIVEEFNNFLYMTGFKKVKVQVF